MKRRTHQREIIRSTIVQFDRPLSPIELHEAVREPLPGIGIATIYRAIRDLLESRWLQVVEMPGESPRYERAGKPHHHHFHCRICDAVLEVPRCPGDVERLAPPGFVTEGHEIMLYGICEDCRELR